MTPRITTFGDRALRFELQRRWRSPGARRSLLAALRGLPGVEDVVLAESMGALVLAAIASVDATREHLRAALEGDATGVATPDDGPALHTVKVVYDGLDLALVASRLALPCEEIIALHAAPEYEVAMLGFMPGFAYLRGLDPRLALPRREAPRPRVPSGSVAIAAEYTGIYPFACPGGWHLLGEAKEPRLLQESGVRFAVGDRVRFESVEPAARVLTQERTSRVAQVAARGAYLDVRRAQGPAIVIDGGRSGRMHEAVPRGGPMVPEALARANAAVGNELGAAGIEVFGAFTVAARGGRLTVADDAGNARQLSDGETFAVAAGEQARVRYLAVRGGVAVRPVLGARGTMLGPRLGGLDGRPLRRDDQLEVGAAARAGSAPLPGPAAPQPAVEVTLGPDDAPEVAAAMLAATFTVDAASDRVGTRLLGPRLPAHPMQSAHDRASAPMVLGAIELTPSGLVVLGPDHPTTGGYPVIAVVRASSLGDMFSRAVGARVRFVS